MHTGSSNRGRVITIAITYVTPDPIDRDLDDHRDAVTAARAAS